METKLITHKDRYNGLTIYTSEQKFHNEESFINALKENMKVWKEKHGLRGLWIQVDKTHSRLIPHIIDLGFEFHHAQPGYVMMCKWLSDSEPNGLPEYANQYIGVGGFVVNDNNELLVVQEKFTSRAHWKLPGGHANCGEDLPETASREVFEETGIKTEFVSLLCFRHQHGYRFGCSDIYFVCLMKPIGGEITPCQQEIAKCSWMDVDEYINQPNVTDANRYVAECYKKVTINGNVSITADRVENFNKTKKNNIYSVGFIEMSADK